MRSLIRLGCVSALAAVLLSGCAGGGEGAPTGSGEPAEVGGPIGAEVEATNFAFDPTEVTIAQGEAIEVVNAGKTLHTLNIDGEGVATGNIPAGQTATADTSGLDAGTYNFFCLLHRAAMKGTLVVEAAE